MNNDYIYTTVFVLFLLSYNSFFFLDFLVYYGTYYSHTAQHEQNDEINDLRAFLISSGAVADATPQFMSGKK